MVDLTSRLRRARPLVQRFAFLALSITVGAGSILGCFYTPSYAVSVDGVELARVSTKEEVAEAIGRVEQRAGSILGRPYTLDASVDFGFGLSEKESLTTTAKVESYLFNHIDEVVKASILTVDGKTVGAVANPADLADLLDDLKAPFLTDDTVSSDFVEDVKVSRDYVSTDELTDLADLRAALTQLREERVEYTVEAGDTLIGIAKTHDLTLDGLLELNPQQDVNSLFPGDVLTISLEVPYLSVETVEHKVYDDVLPFDTQEIPDDTLYEGDSKVLTEGVDGTATYDVTITSVNGAEVERVVNSTTPIVQPTTRVLAVGTKERPKTMATGSFQWPLRGTITSQYGYRRIFGSSSFHSGLDIAAPYGTKIAAADGGKVVFAGTGTGSNWSYGNYVMIDHENGYITIYAHCSSLDVKAGERVYKGQTIARVGSTGRSTGNHCHFTVKVNGSTANPLNYLP